MVYGRLRTNSVAFGAAVPSGSCFLPILTGRVALPLSGCVKASSLQDCLRPLTLFFHVPWPLSFSGLDETEPDEMVLLDIFCITTYLLVDRGLVKAEVADSLESCLHFQSGLYADGRRTGLTDRTLPTFSQDCTRVLDKGWAKTSLKRKFVYIMRKLPNVHLNVHG